MKLRRSRIAALVLLPAGLAGACASDGTVAAFAGLSLNSSNGVTAASDWTAPSTSRAVMAKSAGGDPGFIRPGGTYHAYAQVTDGGNPGSGVASASMDAGLGVIPLISSGGPWTVGGQSYNYRSAQQTLAAATDGNYPATVAMSDLSTPANSQTQSGFSVAVDSVAPSVTNVQTANGGATAGRAEQNDTVTFTFSEPVEPISVLAGWTGTSIPVTVRIANNVASFDRIQVRNAANTAALPITNANGVSLARTDYVGANRDFTDSTMVRSGSTVTLTLGTPSGATTTVTANGTMNWAPLATVTDRAGNPALTTAVNESGTADREF